MAQNIDVKFQGKLTLVLKITGIWQILTRAHKSLKIRTFIGSFNPKQRIYEFKIYEICIKTKKNDAKFEKEVTCRFKI